VGRKSDAREERKRKQAKQFEATKARQAAAVALDPGPKFRTAPALAEGPRAGTVVPVGAGPKAAFDGSRFAHRMTWCVSRKDCDGAWSWGESRAWTADEWEVEIHPPMTKFSHETWGELDKHSSDSGHKMHHGHELSDVAKEAQARWSDLELEQFETLFRFRLGNTKRAWGYVVQAHFFMVWWERKHQIYKVKG